MTNYFPNLRGTEDDSAYQDVPEWDGAVGSSMGWTPREGAGRAGEINLTRPARYSLDFTVAASPVASIGLRFLVSVRPSADLQRA